VAGSPSACGGSDGSLTLPGLANTTSYTVHYLYNGNPVTSTLTTNSSGNLLIIGLAAGSYTGITVTLNGCSSTPGSANINDPNAPLAPTISAVSTAICPGASAILTAIGCSGNVTWNTGQTGSSITVNPAAATNYTATCTLAGCTSTASNTVAITINTPPTILTLDTTGAINGQPTGSLIATASASTPTWEFSINGGTNWWPTGTFNNLAPGLYTLSVRDGFGCITTAAFTINNIIGTTIILNADTASGCPGDYIIIKVYGKGFANIKGVNICITYDPTLAIVTSVPYVASQFQNPITDTSIPGEIYFYDNITPLINIPDGDRIFDIQFRGLKSGTSPYDWNNFKPGICGITDQNGNAMQVSFEPGLMNFYQAPVVTITGNGDVCEGVPVTLSTLGDTLTYQWTLPNGTKFNGQKYSIPSVAASDSGSYILLTTNTLLCTSRDIVQLSVHPAPQIKLAPSRTVCAEGMNEITPGNGFTSYLWQDGSTYPTYVTLGEGTYWVKVTDSYGCSASDTVTLVICPAALYIPSAFSPNSDGLNDVFRARYSNIDVLKNYKMLIYNRWGQLLFEANDINLGWDGNFKGTPCPSGVYTYVIKFDKPVGKTISQKNPYRGMVTLVR